MIYIFLLGLLAYELQLKSLHQNNQKEIKETILFIYLQFLADKCDFQSLVEIVLGIKLMCCY